MLSPIIYDKFQYISLWIFTCFFLQLHFSYKLIFRATSNKYFSIISSLFFLLCPFLFFRLTMHFSLGAHWLILYAFYISFFIQENKKEKHWYCLLFLSLLIHLYFTLMIFIIYFSFSIENYFLKQKFKFELKNLFYKLIFSFLIMFVTGYFESNLINAISTGYGQFKIDLFGFFDPNIDGFKNWSLLLKDLPGKNEIDSFVYVGFGNIILFFIGIMIFLKNIIKKKNSVNNFFLLKKSNLFLIIIFSFLALTINVSILGYEITNIKLPKFIYGILSIFSSTGRFIWPVIYLMLFVSLITLYKNFSKSFVLILSLVIIFIQILDISIGFKNYNFKNKLIIYKDQNDPLWDVIDKNFEYVRTTYLFNNYGPLFSNISKVLANTKNLKTDIILNAAMDRKKAANVRYDLINNLHQYKIPDNTAYIVDNLGHLKQLKKQFSQSDVGFFFRNGLWIILPGKKSLMNNKDILEFNNIKIDEIILNKKYIINFKGKFLGFGWSHNFGKDGSWSDGNNSYLLFKTNKIYKENLVMELSFKSYSKNINNDYELKIYVNNIFNRKIKLKDSDSIKIDLNNNFNENEFLVHLEFSNLVAPIDLFESPDARKLGILLNSFTVK